MHVNRLRGGGVSSADTQASTCTHMPVLGSRYYHRAPPRGKRMRSAIQMQHILFFYLRTLPSMCRPRPRRMMSSGVQGHEWDVSCGVDAQCGMYHEWDVSVGWKAWHAQQPTSACLAPLWQVNSLENKKNKKRSEAPNRRMCSAALAN